VVVRVAVEAARDPRWASVSLCVEDTGLGIEPEAQLHIFEHFVQADGSTTREHGGTGLGLAICKRLLGLMGGEIRVQSEAGQGAKFFVDLCLERSRSRAPAPLSSAALEGLRVLVVDDNATNREILSQQLQGWGMVVRCAVDADDALQAMASAVAASQPFTVALLDMQMPRVDGLALAGMIQGRPELALTKLLLLSSTQAAADQPTRLQFGVLRSLHKPVRRADLFRAVAEVLTGVPPADAPPALTPGEAPMRVQGNVLLVEDNTVNQRVATALLKQLGVNVALAHHGAEAVAMVCAPGGHGFDLALMDWQMPVMDGLEATRRIRAWEVESGREAALPIIALTANALAGDREACIAAGSTDYVTKPYSGAQLAALLSRHMPAATSSPAAPAAGAASAQALAAVVFDSTVLSLLPMVADGSDPGFEAEVLHDYLEASSNTMQECRQAIAAGDAPTALRSVHTLKSMSGQIGALSLAALAADMEAGLRAGDALDMPGFITLQAAHARALEAIAEHLDPGRRHVDTPPTDTPRGPNAR
jgi:CheY-like chemotaxis protein/HPt (histidine-containing phosphotransfer) domain-containing protein